MGRGERVFSWHSIADQVWAGKTFPDACKFLGYSWHDVDRAMSEDVRSFLLDVCMVAGARDEYLGEPIEPITIDDIPAIYKLHTE